MRDIQKVLELWGGWAASDNAGVDYSPIAAGFKGLLPHKGKARLSCSDDDALIVEGCLAKLRNHKPYEHTILVAYYLFNIPKRKIAKKLRKDEKLIRIELQLAEGFIEGCLSILSIKLDSDC